MSKDTLSQFKNKPLRFKFGIGLLILYPILWIIVPIVPFTPFSLSVKGIIVTSIIIIGEIILLSGIALTGKEVVMKIKEKLKFRKRRKIIK